MSTRWRIVVFVGGLLATALGMLLWLHPPPVAPIRIGVLHSLSGTMAVSERPLVDAVRLAVEEINAAGGLLGRPVEIHLADGRSDNAAFAAEAERLVAHEKVSALFACWTSACRTAVKPVVELHGALMFYPLQYEGLEQSPAIYYTGSAPNQQIIPGTRWAMDTLGKRVYLVGSDYIFPRTANLLVRDLVEANQGAVLAERYRPLGDPDFGAIVAEIRGLKPDVILNTINGDSNVHFFRALKDAGLGTVPVMSFSVAEAELKAIGPAAFHPHHFAVWSYFQSLPGEDNRRFVAAFKQRYGADRVTSDPTESAYVGVRLWAQAVRDAGTAAPEQVNHAMHHQSMAAPSGLVAVDRTTHHLWKQVRIGRARADGQFDIVWTSGEALRPQPFPDYRSPAEWEAMVRQLSGGRT
ncbi:urea ABC transporter substrate-binding protein [Thiobacillus sedimenti]|uniref:Urea ABC transporter substrate-binding protein n=1 Tax=Thiobacillus sedimenti TaxID=3110231 RepID=A0ABZ1CM30_9PROT|nr:urea ABC transporter substrate-binding protein [Thiobacillus sp. SCUT-2]WRS40440.1 urea ABC transporter substrate-binding protein [Thiobacillus sp. SCUT-2]